jgi:hypothetical protein
MVSQTIFSVKPPAKNKTTVKSHKKNPKIKNSARAAEKNLEPQPLTDPPTPPQQPRTAPRKTKTRMTQRTATGPRKAYYKLKKK